MLPVGSPLPLTALSFGVPAPLENTEVLMADRVTVKQPAREVACGHCGATVSAGAGVQDFVPLSTGGAVLAVVHRDCRREMTCDGGDE